MNDAFRTRCLDQGFINKQIIISIVICSRQSRIMGVGVFAIQLKHQVFGTGCDMECCRGYLAQVKKIEI